MSRRFALTVAPRFHVPARWPERIEIRCGPDWEHVGASEIGELVTATPGLDEVLPAGRAALIALPAHLRESWWQAAEGIDEAPPGGAPPGGAPSGAELYPRFVQAVVDFFSFKRLPMPESCSFDVRVSKPGLATTRFDGSDAGELVAWINLGDEDSRVVVDDVRLRLGAGEGVWLTAPHCAVDGDTRGKSEIDVVLTLRRR